MDATNFNGTKLLNGSYSGINFQIGATTGSESKIAITIGSVDVTQPDLDQRRRRGHRRHVRAGYGHRHGQQ